MLFFFFFQAEDGIRDRNVTGVQTCALPILRIAGQYHVKTEPPFIPGSEAAGEILQLGADVKGLKVGDRVLCGGGFAQETVQAASSVIKLPDTVGFEAAAAFRSNYTTAYYALQRGRLRP